MPYYNANGVDLYYEVRGKENAAHTVMFFNGVMASVSSWYALSGVLEGFGFRCILHDFKGQLKSGKPEGPYSFRQHAAEARSLLHHLGAEATHIIGTSYGGEVAMRFAIDYPEAAESITVIDSVSELDPVLEGFVLGWKTLCDTGSGKAFFEGMAPSIYGPIFMRENAAWLQKRAEGKEQVDPSYFTGQKILYNTFVADVTMTEELHRIGCPALVLCGEEDILKRPRFSQIIADHIAGSEYLTIPNCGHVAIFEKPRELASAIVGFILKNTTQEVTL